MNITLKTIHSGYDRKTCWTHARPGVIPSADENKPPIAIVTMHKLRLSGCDVFYEINDMRSDDGGETWSEPTPHKDTLGRCVVENNIEESICDFSPGYHEKTGVLLGTGHTVRYVNDDLQPAPRPRSTAYSVYNSETKLWSRRQNLQMPDDPKFFNAGAGSTQRLDLPNGDILLPIYFAQPGSAKGAFNIKLLSTVVRCGFDGATLKYLEHGTELTVPEPRGLYEPSIAIAAGQYFLTLRNDEAGYVATSTDGLHYDKPQRWTFDDGSDLGNYNTQQHWVTNGDNLYLVYTRRGANNDHIPRHRAPLFIAKVDTEKLCVIRDSEQILVPQRGARLGNFGVAKINENESWVVVSEWMQTTLPNPYDCTVCEKYGSDNIVFLAKITF